jgi:hypothetical protein
MIAVGSLPYFTSVITAALLSVCLSIPSDFTFSTLALFEPVA